MELIQFCIIITLTWKAVVKPLLLFKSKYYVEGDFSIERPGSNSQQHLLFAVKEYLWQNLYVTRPDVLK